MGTAMEDALALHEGRDVLSYIKKIAHDCYITTMITIYNLAEYKNSHTQL